MSRRRTEYRLAALIVAGVGLLLTAIVGLFVFMSVTATPIHPDPQEAPSETRSAPSPAWQSAVEQARHVARTALSGQNLPGLSVAVGAGGEVVWAEGFGWADLETRVPVTPDTRFRIGTASKALTSAAVGLLLEQGRLNLDDPIQEYVPSFPAKQWPVTLRQLMGHVAGIRRDAGDEEPVHVHCEQATDAIPRFAESPLLFEPGTQYRYSSYGWILVSAAVETAADERFASFMRRRVFEPVGLDDTKTDAGTVALGDDATYYFPKFAADPRYGPQAPDEEDFSCFAGAAAFVSTPSDLVRFAMMIAGRRFLQPATVQLLQASQRLASGEETGYSLGWDLETVTLAGRATRAIGHDGELRGGPVMSFLTFPEHGIVVAVASNTSFADTFPLAVSIAEIFAGQANAPARR